jgi:hypothetical protein
MEAIMDRRRHPSDQNVNLTAGILAAAMLGIFAVVFIYNYSGDRAGFAGKNEPQVTSSQNTGSAYGRSGSTTGQSTPQ